MKSSLVVIVRRVYVLRNTVIATKMELDVIHTVIVWIVKIDLNLILVFKIIILRLGINF